MPETTPTNEELAARVAELEAAAQESQWRLARLAGITDPVEKTIIGIWEQMYAQGLGATWNRWFPVGNELRPVLTMGLLLRPDLNEAESARLAAVLERSSFPLDKTSTAAVAFLENRAVAVADIFGEEGEAFPATREIFVNLRGVSPSIVSGDSAQLAVPLRVPGGMPIGALGLTREASRPYTDEEIRLVQDYAEQMAVVMVNARAAEELETRNRELADSEEQQRTLAEVLEVIARSPVGPRHRARGNSAQRDCPHRGEKRPNSPVRRRSTRLRGAFNHEGRLARDEGTALPFADHPGGAAILERRTIHVHGTPEEVDRQYPGTVRLEEERSGLAIVATPFLREGEPLGCLVVRRHTARPFTPQEIALLEAFADQAVIAIENARLFRGAAGGAGAADGDGGGTGGYQQRADGSEPGARTRSPVPRLGCSAAKGQRLAWGHSEKRDLIIDDVYARILPIH